MYLQKVPNKVTVEYGSADPDPYQNFMDLQHCW
jgi:hypothetical protein